MHWEPKVKRVSPHTTVFLVTTPCGLTGACRCFGEKTFFVYTQKPAARNHKMCGHNRFTYHLPVILLSSNFQYAWKGDCLIILGGLQAD